MTDHEEKTAILAALKQADGNVGRAARALHTPRRTLQRRMRRYGIAEGKRGRPLERAPRRYGKRALRYGKRALRYAVPAAVALVGGALLVRARGTST